MPKKKRPISTVLARRQSGELGVGQGSDLSGRDFRELSIQGKNFFEFIFNGCSFEGLRASQSIFQHAEFTEAQFSRCVFEDASFDHSDFVLTDVRDSEFVRCSFQNAEWRDTLFDNVRFRQCIFRNTTTSLTRFIGCDFDETSAANFVGPSKRFSVFSGTRFPLATEQISFLQTNFGITSEAPTSTLPLVHEDPLFELSIRRYAGRMTSGNLYQLVLRDLVETTRVDHAPQRLRMKYLAAICRVSMEEEILSVFAMQRFERALSGAAPCVQDRDQALEMLSLMLAFKVSLRERVTSIEQEIASVPVILARGLRFRMEFEANYERPSVQDYFHQMATYCHLPVENIVIDSLQTGSTIVEVLIAGAVQVAEVFRFIRYSLSLATITIKQAGKLRKEYSRLGEPAVNRGKPARVGASSRSVAKRRRPEPSMENVTKEIVGVKLENAKSIEVFVDSVNERVLVVDGRVRVTISLANS